jgi:transcription termination/antitermination protein NusG
MTEDEIQRLLRGIPNKKDSRFIFRLGESVRIKTGLFTSFIGKVEGINQTRFLLKVTVNIFGRSQPLELGFPDVEKISAS